MATSSSNTAFSMTLRAFRPAATLPMFTRFLTFIRSPITSFTLTSDCSRKAPDKRQLRGLPNLSAL